jgi:hypothetical protein
MKSVITRKADAACVQSSCHNRAAALEDTYSATCWTDQLAAAFQLGSNYCHYYYDAKTQLALTPNFFKLQSSHPLLDDGQTLISV